MQLLSRSLLTDSLRAGITALALVVARGVDERSKEGRSPLDLLQVQTDHVGLGSGGYYLAVELAEGHVLWLRPLPVTALVPSTEAPLESVVESLFGLVEL